MTTFRLNLGAMRKHAERRVSHVVEAAAIIARDAVVEEMESATPTGEMGRIPGTNTSYTMSAPGEPPAIREGTYRDSVKSTPAVRQGAVIRARAYTDLKVGNNGEYVLGQLLEYGTSDLVNYRTRMEPRPHWRPAFERVKPEVAQLVHDASS